MPAARILTVLSLLVITACAGAERGGSLQLDVPDDVKADLETGAPAESYVYYALAQSPPVSWEDIQAGGIWICDGRPPLVPHEIVAMIDGGGFLPGTQLQLSTDDFENASNGRVKSALETSVRVSIGITLQGCIDSAIEGMRESPGGILLTERDADFEGKDRLSELSFD